jgi:predicted O-linked N-acetylglucosamine transferase (SPINDLY family)
MLADAARNLDALASGLAAIGDCDWHSHGAWLAAAAQFSAAPAARIDDPAIVLHALAGGLPAPACATLRDAHLRAVLAASAPYPSTERLLRKQLRVGYLAGPADDSLQDALLAGLLACHARESFEPVVYAYAGLDTPLAVACRANAVLLRPIAHLKPHEAQGLVRVDDIDVLVDLCGLHDRRAAALLLLRPARAHVHLATSLSAAAHRAMPWVSLPPISVRPVADRRAQQASLGLPDRGAILGCLSPAWMIGPETFAAWMEALAATADSHLLLVNISGAAQANLGLAAANANVAPARLHYATADSLAQTIAIARLADVLVEPLHATDALDAAAAQACAVPLVAPGGAARENRPGACVLRQAGLGEFAVADRTGYVARTVELLGNPEALAQARARFANVWRGEPQNRFAEWVRTLEARLEATYAERVSLASANGR